MAVAGLPEPRPDHAEAIAHFAMACSKFLPTRTRGTRPPGFKMRIGIHTGPVVAGIIGRHKFIYDVWGDTVNIASRMESSGNPDCIHVSGATVRSLAGRFELRPRGLVELKGHGHAETFFLLGPIA